MHYQFPVTFKVNIVEHKVVAYYVTGERPLSSIGKWRSSGDSNSSFGIAVLLY